MTDLMLHSESTNQAIPLPPPRQGPINIRLARLDDIPFIDALQKQHNKMVGFFPRAWFESNIRTGHVLIAEELPGVDEPRHIRGSGSGGTSFDVRVHNADPLPYGRGSLSSGTSFDVRVHNADPLPHGRGSLSSGTSFDVREHNADPLPHGRGSSSSGTSIDDREHNADPLPYGRGSSSSEPLGYCVYKDKYLKREELGIVYQLNVLPGKQRGLIGASLVKAAFERCPYGVKLFCCWCAQDIEANHFWESIGFVPIAFRTGSRPRKRKDGTISKPERIHIFWQRRIREGDAGPASGGTPYWFPSETSGGAVKENRIVLPIPPGTHWSDAKPSVLPGFDSADAEEGAKPLSLQPHPRKKSERRASAAPALPAKPRGGLWFGPSAQEVAAAKAEAKERKKRTKPEKRKNDPKYVAAARELRDRYLEDVNCGNALPAAAHGKYDVSRQVIAGETLVPLPEQLKVTNLLDAA